MTIGGSIALIITGAILTFALTWTAAPVRGAAGPGAPGPRVGAGAGWVLDARLLRHARAAQRGTHRELIRADGPYGQMQAARTPCDAPSITTR